LEVIDSDGFKFRNNAGFVITGTNGVTSNGVIEVIAGGPITVNSGIQAAGSVTVTCTALTVNAGINSTGSFIVINSAQLTNNSTIQPSTDLTVNGITFNNSTIQAGQGRALFTGNYSGTGALNGNTNPASSMEFRGNVTFNPGTGYVHNGTTLVFSGSNTQSFNSGGNTLAGVNIHITGGTPALALAADATQADAMDLVITGCTLDCGSAYSWIMGTGSPAPLAPAFAGLSGTATLNGGAKIIAENLDHRNTIIVTGGSAEITVNEDARLNGLFDLSAGSVVINAGGDVDVGANWGVTVPANITQTTIEMRGINKTLDVYAGKEIGNLIIAAGASTSLYALTQTMAIAGDVTINGAGRLDAANMTTLTLKGNWTNNNINTVLDSEGIPVTASFFPGDSEVIFDRTGISDKIILITGNTYWNKFTCTSPGVEIRFSTYPDEHHVKSQFTARGPNAAGKIKLTRIGGNPAPAQKPDPNDPAPWKNNTFWYFYLRVGGILDIAHLEISYSAASRRLPIPSIQSGKDVTASPYHDAGGVSYYNVNWISIYNFIFAFSEDSDANGRIDRIRLQAAFELNRGANSFDGFAAELTEGYTAKGYAPAGSDPDKVDSIYVLIDEKELADGGKKDIGIKIASNPNLRDQATGMLIEEGNWISVTDTVYPRVTYALALPNHNEVFIQFSEPVSDSIEFTIRDGTGTIATIRPGYSAAEYPLTMTQGFTAKVLAEGSAFFTVSAASDFAGPAPVDAEQAADPDYPLPKYPVSWRYNAYAAAGGSVGPPYAPPPNYPSDTSLTHSHRLTDLLISIPPLSANAGDYFVWPVWATNSETTSAGLTNNSLTSPDTVAFDLIHDFTGKDHLENRDIVMQVKTNGDLPGFVPELYYAANISDQYKAGPSHGPEGIWLPDFTGTAVGHPLAFSNIVPKPYPGAAVLSNPLNPAQGLFNFNLSKAEYENRSSVEFYFRLHTIGSAPDENIYAARLAGEASGDWYRRVKPFSFEIRDTILQRGGVTILNNVINPNTGERVYLDYKLNSRGRVTIQVFTLDGTLVKALVRENKDAGEYRTFWDGRNQGGRAVARGMYFIRVVAPEIDEIRKVMVVK
jgi:hypothetical protein